MPAVDISGTLISCWPMVSVTRLNIGLPLRAATVPVEPPRALSGLRLGEVWAYPRASLFFVWRDAKIRCKQTAIGVLWIVSATCPHRPNRLPVLDGASAMAYRVCSSIALPPALWMNP
jgi:hypothetical protein